jgi:hypothetical protein
MLTLKKLTMILAAAALSVSPIATLPVHAASGIFASGGKTVTEGEKFTITVKASGTNFDSLQGSISVSGPVSIVSFSAGSATWLPGKSPANGQQFVGITTTTNSLTVATIVLKGTKEGSGSVNVSGVRLAKEGAVVATDAGGTSFKINRAPVLPGQISVSSSTHPDQGQAYTERTIALAWDKPSGVTEFSYLLDQAAGTTPATKATGTGTSASYENKDIGTYYFHIRGKNGDGWGGTTHYKIMIKEPDPAINDTLDKPVIKTVTKLDPFSTDLEAGTMTGLTFTGTAPAGYTVNLSASPAFIDVPAEKLATTATAEGTWTINLDVPVKAGFYKLTAQGVMEKVLTPISDPVKVELSLAKGGEVRYITEKDIVQTPSPTPSAVPTKVNGARSNMMTLVWVALGALVATGVVAFIVRRRRK